MGMMLGKNEINVCRNCEVPLIFTFRWAYREKFCINCGGKWDVFGGDEVQSTPELKRMKKIIDRIWKNLYGSGYLLPISRYQKNNCKKCKGEDHPDHLSKRERRNNRVAERILKNMEGAFA